MIDRGYLVNTKRKVYVAKIENSAFLLPCLAGSQEVDIGYENFAILLYHGGQHVIYSYPKALPWKQGCSRKALTVESYLIIQ